MSRFQDALCRQNWGSPPIWFMRQAGRYHQHYQELRSRYAFETLCKTPKLAAETAWGPVKEFGFDAAILFSDILFHLDALGMGLSFTETGPKLSWHLDSLKELVHLGGGESKIDELVQKVSFQKEALVKTREMLDLEGRQDCGLIGFIGAPFTLFCYAATGKGESSPDIMKAGLSDGRYVEFCLKSRELLLRSMVMKSRAGAQMIAVFDPSAGLLDPETFSGYVATELARIFSKFKNLCPATAIAYYSKGTGPEHWNELKRAPFDILAVDWNHDLPRVLEEFSEFWGIQGNIDPHWLLLESAEMESRLREVFTRVKALPAEKRLGWICSLGHGVLPNTPESNVKLFISIVREMFHEDPA